jgi:thioredoxin-like negative regulator of GroEL
MWVLTGLVWAGSAAYARYGDRRRAVPSDPSADVYVEAREQYLKGNWFEAECLLTRILQRNPRDLEARLLLATLLRHTGRRDEAANQLDRLERFEGSGKWGLEISRERQQLQAAKTDDEHGEQEAALPPPAADASLQAA